MIGFLFSRVSFLHHTHADFVFLSPSLSLLCLSDVLALPIFKQEDTTLPPESETKNPPFQYVLCAATSPAVKLHDETLTYLNQGEREGFGCKTKATHKDFGLTHSAAFFAFSSSHFLPPQ